MSGTSVIDYLDDPELLGKHFVGASWACWRAVLKGAFALPMTEVELELFNEVAGGRPPPQRPIRELVCCIGRSGGKDAVASALATWLGTTADTSHLRAGEFATIDCFATDKEQAGIALAYIRGYFEDAETPLLRGMIKIRNRRPAITEDTIELTNRVKIAVATNNRRSPRGKTIAVAIYDECAFWYNEHYSNPDVETDTAVSPGLARFPGSLKILISSVNRRSGLLYDRYARFFGKDDADTLVVAGSSLKFNPTLDATIIDRELERDPERAAAEYLCQWRDDLTLFLDRELVESAVDRGVIVRPPDRRLHYEAFADASSGRGDSFTGAICHQEGTMCVLDCLYEKRSPFSADLAVSEFAALLRSYGITAVTADRYAVGFVEAAFQREGIRYLESEKDKSQLYLEALPLFTSGRVRLLDNHRLVHQFTQLERRTSPIGKDSVSHPDYKNAHDDLANAAAGGLVLAASERRGFIVSETMLQWARTPPLNRRFSDVYGRTGRYTGGF